MDSNMSAPKDLCKYTIIRFTEDEIRDEPVNVGVLVHHPASGSWCPKILSDFRSKVPAEVLRKEQSVINAFLASLTDVEQHKEFLDEVEHLEKLERRLKGGRISLTRPRAALSEDPMREADWLFQRLVLKKGQERAESQSKFVSDFSKILEEWNVLATKSESSHRLRRNIQIPGTQGVIHKADFAFVNGRTLVVEVMDLAMGQQAQGNLAARKTVKILDLSRHLKNNLTGFTVFRHNGEAISARAKSYLQILQDSTQVYDFSNAEEAKKLREDLRTSLRRMD
jgi:hypothetical protein